MRNRFKPGLLAGVLTLTLLAPITTTSFAQTNTGAPPASQVPQPDQGGVNWQGVGYGAGALASNILYIPAKLVYALLGGLVGGGAWVLTAGNTQTANTIWRSSLGGDYVVTPDMIAGKEPVHFSGPTDTPPDATSASVQPIAPAPSTTAAMPPASNPPAYVPSSSSGGPQPMDRGAGAVGHPSGPSTLPDTSIE